MTSPLRRLLGAGCRGVWQGLAGFNGLTGASLVLVLCLHVHLVCPSLSGERFKELTLIMSTLYSVRVLLEDEVKIRAIAVPEAPRNLTLTDIDSHRVTIQWIAPLTDHIKHFEMVLHPVGEIKYPGKSIIIVEGTRKSVLVTELLPDTEYEITLRAVNSDGVSNMSSVLAFKTLSDSMEAKVARLHVRFGEVTVVALILAAWMGAVAAFLHRWGKIRIITHREYRYKHSPKNLDTIKIVKRPTDSVIYKSYTPEYSKTMLAREKRLARMNTMPNISLGASSKEKDTEMPTLKGKKFSRFKTMPVIELDELTSETQT